MHPVKMVSGHRLLTIISSVTTLEGAFPLHAHKLPMGNLPIFKYDLIIFVQQKTRVPFFPPDNASIFFLYL